MIQDTSAMDQPIGSSRPLARRLLVPGILVGALLLAVVFVAPSLSRWLRAERSIDLSKIRVATVVRGDLERDVSVQGRIVAAFHPTTSSPADRHRGPEGARRRRGRERSQVLAVVSSPELESRLQQERSSLLVAGVRPRAPEDPGPAEDPRRPAGAWTWPRSSSRRRSGPCAGPRRSGPRASSTPWSTRRPRTTCAAPSWRWPTPGRAPSSSGRAWSSRSATASWTSSASGWWCPTSSGRWTELAVRAPVAGLVSRLDVQDHDAVIDRASRWWRWSIISAFEIEVLVPESYADEIGPGTPAVVTYSGQEYDGAGQEHLARGGGQPGAGHRDLRRATPRRGCGRTSGSRPGWSSSRRPDVLKVRAVPSSRAAAGTRPTSSTPEWPLRRDIRVGRRERGRGGDRQRARGGRPDHHLRHRALPGRRRCLSAGLRRRPCC